MKGKTGNFALIPLTAIFQKRAGRQVKGNALPALLHDRRLKYRPMLILPRVGWISYEDFRREMDAAVRQLTKLSRLEIAAHSKMKKAQLVAKSTSAERK